MTADRDAELVRMINERDAWKDTAEQHCRNEFFYRDLLSKIGDLFGEAARTSDDGSIQDSVLALKVPELVASEIAALRRRVEPLEQLARVMREWREHQPLLRLPIPVNEALKSLSSPPSEDSESGTP